MNKSEEFIEKWFNYIPSDCECEDHKSEIEDDKLNMEVEFESLINSAVEEALKGKDLVLPIPYRVGVKTRKVLNINRNLKNRK